MEQSQREGAQLNIRISKLTKSRLAKQAWYERRTQSDIVETLLTEYLDQHKEHNLNV